MATHTRKRWHDRIKAVEKEYFAARKAADHLIEALRMSKAALPLNLQVRDVGRMSSNLEGTYLIRLYAAFEAGLRSFWMTIRDTAPPSRDLIESIAARRRIPDAQKDLVHEVREFRNSLVHEGNEEAEIVALSMARGHLQQFLSWLPKEW